MEIGDELPGRIILNIFLTHFFPRKLKLKISVITVCLNSEFTIEATILSVLGQSHAPYEYIVVDGGSTDRTPEIVAKYTDIKYFSEPDRGIYDAMNKGIHLSSGDVIVLINSDDVFANRDVFKTILEIFMKRSDLSAIYGNVRFKSDHLTAYSRRHWRVECCTLRDLLVGRVPPHPSLFVRSAVYDRLGCYDLRYPIAADFDFFVRLYSQSASCLHIDEDLVLMGVGGKSTSSIASIITQNRESFHIIRERFGTSRAVVFLLLKLSRKLTQLL
jgi:glycosyltransferase involved in cell wall biosynthesis